MPMHISVFHSQSDGGWQDFEQDHQTSIPPSFSFRGVWLCLCLNFFGKDRMLFCFRQRTRFWPRAVAFRASFSLAEQQSHLRLSTTGCLGI